MANNVGYCTNKGILSSRHIAKVETPSGGLLAGDIVAIKELDSPLYNDYEIYTASLPNDSDIESGTIGMVVNGGFEALEDGRRPEGQPNFTNYAYAQNEIATVVLFHRHVRFEHDVASVTNATVDNPSADIGKYLIATSGEKGTTVSSIPNGWCLRILGIRHYPLGGLGVTNYLDTYVCIVTNDDRFFSLTYNANGGTGTLPATKQYGAGVPVAIDFSSVPTKANAIFLGYSTNASTGTPIYTSFDTNTITLNQNTTLYAIWGSTTPIMITKSYELMREDFTIEDGVLFISADGMTMEKTKNISYSIEFAGETNTGTAQYDIVSGDFIETISEPATGTIEWGATNAQIRIALDGTPITTEMLEGFSITTTQTLRPNIMGRTPTYSFVATDFTDNTTSISKQIADFTHTATDVYTATVTNAFGQTNKYVPANYNGEESMYKGVIAHTETESQDLPIYLTSTGLLSIVKNNYTGGYTDIKVELYKN